MLLTFSAAGFIIILILTVLFGRVYCSTICPLGFLQDVINFAGKKIKGKKRQLSFLKDQKLLRWILVAIAVIPFVFGIALGINLLDPYSIYGRIVVNIFRPIIVLGNNLLSSLLEVFNVFSLYPYELKIYSLIPVLIAFLYLAFVSYLAFTKGRLFCNTVCPVGTLLGYISKYSLFKIVIDKEDCLNCGLCELDCKGNCINSEDQSVDMSRCVMCFNCINSCPTEGIKFSNTFKRENFQTLKVDQSKRNFLISTGVYFTTVSTILAQAKKKILVTKKSTVPVLRNNAVSPPGSISVERFNSKCTACGLCVSSCPTQVLQPSFLEYGFLGMMQPRFDNSSGFCNFDCTICGDVCPTGAILPVIKDKKQLIQVGKAKFIEDNCIVKMQKTDCGACAEHCPTKAVHMIPYENNLVIPEVREEYCVGCGACEFACPVIPYKSIYVEGNPLHLTAKKNVEQEKPKEKIDYKEEFPF